MSTIPPSQKPDLVRLIDKAHEDRAELPRHHLGASLLGHHCDRWLWLSFRWAVREPFPGRILRLFRRGHHEEAWVVSDLRAAGLHITNTGSKQARVGFGGHVGGSMDGIVESGVPEAPQSRHVLEIKTHALKSFKDLANGVEKSKPMHYAQMQVYMLGSKIDRALYVAVCKDDDNLHIERVKLDKPFAQALVDRGHRIVASDRMPEPCLNASPSWYLCRFCPGYGLCHEQKVATEVNCRTCLHSTAEQDGTWSCARWGSEIPSDAQFAGCDSHIMHPDLVTWHLNESASTDTVAAWTIDGVTVRNGDPSEGEGIYLTSEIIANPDACKARDPVIEKIRTMFDAKVVG